MLTGTECYLFHAYMCVYMQCVGARGGGGDGLISPEMNTLSYMQCKISHTVPHLHIYMYLCTYIHVQSTPQNIIYMYTYLEYHACHWYINNQTSPKSDCYGFEFSIINTKLKKVKGNIQHEYTYLRYMYMYMYIHVHGGISIHALGIYNHIIF